MSLIYINWAKLNVNNLDILLLWLKPSDTKQAFDEQILRVMFQNITKPSVFLNHLRYSDVVN